MTFLNKTIAVVILFLLCINLAACQKDTNADIAYQPVNVDSFFLFFLQLSVLSCGGYQLPSDTNISFPFVTYFAKQYFEETGREEHLNQKPGIPSAEQLEEGFGMGDYETLMIFAKEISESDELIQAALKNPWLSKNMTFFDGMNCGEIYRTVETCRALGIDYDYDLLLDRLVSDMEEKTDIMQRLALLTVVCRLNSDFELDIPISDGSDFIEDAENRLRAAFDGRELMSYNIFEYFVLTQALGVPRGITENEAAMWFESFRCDDGAFGLLMSSTQGEPNGIMAAIRLSDDFGVPIDIDYDALDSYFISRQRSDGNYTSLDFFADCNFEETFYAYGALELLGADVSQNVKTLFSSVPAKEDLVGNTFYESQYENGGDIVMDLMYCKYMDKTGVSADSAVSFLENTYETLEQTKEIPYPIYNKLAFYSNLSLDLIKEAGGSLPEGLEEKLCSVFEESMPENSRSFLYGYTVISRLNGNADLRSLPEKCLEFWEKEGITANTVLAMAYCADVSREVFEAFDNNEEAVNRCSVFLKDSLLPTGLYADDVREGYSRLSLSWGNTFGALLFKSLWG